MSNLLNVNMTQNEHVYAICNQYEIDDDVITGQNVKTIEGLHCGNKFLAPAVSKIFQKQLFCDGDRSDGVNAICSRP